MLPSSAKIRKITPLTTLAGAIKTLLLTTHSAQP